MVVVAVMIVGSVCCFPKGNIFLGTKMIPLIAPASTFILVINMKVAYSQEIK